jgi:hypothetical protein
MILLRADWVVAGRSFSGGRKVRAPQDRAVGNAHRPQGQGKCNRKQTASRIFFRAVTVR